MPPLVDCKWQSKFTLAVGAKMESDSFVREFERLSSRAGIGMIPSLSSPNRRCTLVETSVVIKIKEEEGGEKKTSLA